MKIIDIKERYQRGRVIKHDVIDCITGEISDLYEYPLVDDINPGDNLGDIIDTYGESIIAPNNWPKWTLWHIILNGSHVRYKLTKAARN